MKIIVTWSNGTTSELEVESPDGAAPLQTSFQSPKSTSRPQTALHRQPDGSWACYNQNKVLLGYCLPPKMQGRAVEGLTWVEACADPAICRAIPYLDENEWENDRQLRLANAEKFHFHGHATEQEAIDCYQQFLKDFGQQEPLLSR